MALKCNSSDSGSSPVEGRKMLIPRLITFLVMVFCALGATAFYFEEFFAFPMLWMKLVSAGALALCATSAFVMLIGTLGMQKTGDSITINRNTLLGKMMAKITSSRPTWAELHCCDIYIDTTVRTALLLFVLVLCAAMIFLVGMLGFLFYKVPSLLLFVVSCGLGAIAVLFVGSLLLDFAASRLPKRHAHDRRHKNKKRNAAAATAFQWISSGIQISVVIFVVYLIGYGLYKLWQSLTVEGSTLPEMLLFSLVPIVAVCFPLLCIVGKKILLRTGFAKEICPPVRR